jgi:hypothetical protein
MKIYPLSAEQESHIPTGLIRELRSKNVHLFVGSGLSIPLGYPSWESLIFQMYEKIQAQLPYRDNKNREWLKNNFTALPDWTAEVLKSAPGDLYKDSLKEIFKRSINNSSSIPHSLISLIPFKGYVTTNFDSLLESYISLFSLNKPNIYDYKDIFSNPRKSPHPDLSIYKIHGCATKDLDSIILTSSDYYKLLHDQRYIRFLDDLFSKNIILTIGYSLRDKDFRSFVEERYHLYGVNCAPMYSIIGKSETCPMETALYRDKYNIHLVPISEAKNFVQLSSFLLSLYCLTYQIDSACYGQDIIEIINSRLDYNMSLKSLPRNILAQNVTKAKELMSVFQEPVDLDLFTTLCVDAGLPLSPAHLKAIFHCSFDKLYIEQKVRHTKNIIKFVANWLSNYFDAIPLGTSSRYLSIYHKRFLKDFPLTISYLLSEQEGWNELIGNDAKSSLRLRRINEFFRQEGKWIQWLEISNKAESFLEKKSTAFIELMKTKMWVFFWTRRFREAKELLRQYPQIDEGEGQYSYAVRMKYMDSASLSSLVKSLESKKSLDYFNRSLLGRTYARLSLKERNHQKRREYLVKAKYNVRIALKGAKRVNDMIEISVQSWYLAIICSELQENKEADKYLSEVRRLDETIMDRKPGKAWLTLAEYRLIKNRSEYSNGDKNTARDMAIEAMDKLGVINAKGYVEREYLY